MADSKGIGFWKDMWHQNDIFFHKSEVHKMLQKHSPLLFTDGEAKKFFVPLCGKTLDMIWLLGEGHDVTGLEGVEKALEDFCSENSFERSKEDVPSLGPEGQLFKIKDRKLKLYLSNILLFNKSFEGQFDCVWDRGSLVAVDRKDIKKYVAVLKDILKPGGKILVETIEYDPILFEDLSWSPPALPLFKDEMQLLFEPDFTVKMVDKDKRLLKNKEVELAYYFIVKN